MGASTASSAPLTSKARCPVIDEQRFPVIKKVVVQGTRITLEARAIGGLGWTWCYQIGDREPVKNLGRLLGNEDDAFDAALSAAVAAMQDTGRLP